MEVLNILKLSKNLANTSSVFLRNCGGPKICGFFSFFVFDKITGHRVTNFLPSFSHQYCQQLLSHTFFSNLKKYFYLFFISSFDHFDLRRRDRVVGRAVDGKIKIPSSSPAAEVFCSRFFHLSHLRKAKETTPHLHFISFFCQRKLRIFLKNHYINCRYDRRFTEDFRPPHFWQTSLN